MIPSLARSPSAPRTRAVATLLVAMLVALVVPVGAARASGDAAADLTRWIGEERAAAGVAGLQVASDLVQVATRHSQRMAAEGRLHHNESLTSEVDGWERLTENVGYGPDARSVHDAFMASSSHRANILDAGVTQVGVGVAFEDGTLWVTQVFRRPSSSAPASPAPPAPTTEPEPEPAAAPAPTTAPTTAAPTAGRAPARVSEQAVLLVRDTVAPAPAPDVVVDTADDGQVALAPVPVAARVMTATRWLVVLASLLDG